MTITGLLEQGDTATIKSIYDEHKASFIAFVIKLGAEKEDCIDIYQDAIIALVENARKGKLANLKSSISTYLFAIGKYMVYRRKARAQNLVFDETVVPENFFWDEYDNNVHEDKINQLNRGFALLGDQCRKLLALFYYEEKKLDEITHLLQYENKDVAKSQKSRCLKKLKNLIQQANG